MAINIKPENRGKFTAAAKKPGKGVQEYASQILANKENYSPTLVKRANFAHNAASWKHEQGGLVKYPEGGDVIGPKYWSYRDPRKDTTIENIAEMVPIPFVSMPLTVNDWMDATRRVVNYPNQNNITDFASETLNFLPGAKLLRFKGAEPVFRNTLAGIYNTVKDVNNVKEGFIPESTGKRISHKYAKGGLVKYNPGGEVVDH